MGDKPEIFIVRRHSNYEEEHHHGGAWKIAFADFMTAMMAFFLVLWIINATDKDTKLVLARYFNPVKVENPSASTKGVHGIDSRTKNVSNRDHRKGIGRPRDRSKASAHSRKRRLRAEARR